MASGEGNVVMVPDDSFPSVVVGWRSSGCLWRRPVLSTIGTINMSIQKVSQLCSHTFLYQVVFLHI